MAKYEGTVEAFRYTPTTAKLRELPDHEFGWDKVTVEHTDPTKVANAIATHREMGSYTDRFIQEELLGQDYEEWQDAQREQATFLKELDEIRGVAQQEQNAQQEPKKKKPAKDGGEEKDE